MRWNKFITKDIELSLRELVKRGYLKKTEQGWIDSNKVTSLLKEGKTRREIARILDKKDKQ